MERKWRKSQYSVNSETSFKEDEGEDKANYNVNNMKIEQLATHKSKKENEKNVNIKISVPQHQPSTEPQLTASETDNCNSNNEEASSITAKQGKSIIPAHSNFKNSSNYGSPNYTDYIDSIKELGPIDNTFKNTYFGTRTFANVKYNKINPTDPTDPTLNPITNSNLTKYQPAIVSKTHHEPKPRISYRQNSIKGQRQGRDKILINPLAQKMVPKIAQIHTRNILILPVKLKYKFAPKSWQIKKSITSAEQNLKLPPKNIWIQNLITLPKSNIKLVKIINWINDILGSAVLIYNFAPKNWQITNLIKSAERNLKMAPKNSWILNSITLPKFNNTWIKLIDWNNDILGSAKIKQDPKMESKEIRIENLMLNNKLALLTRIDIHEHTKNRIDSKCNKLTTLAIISLYKNLYKSTVSATAAQPIPTIILIQTVSFMIHAGSTGTNAECVDYTNRKGVTDPVTGVQSQHLWHTLMNAVPTPGILKTTMERNGNCKWKGGSRQMKGAKG